MARVAVVALFLLGGPGPPLAESLSQTSSKSWVTSVSLLARASKSVQGPREASDYRSPRSSLLMQAMESVREASRKATGSRVGVYEAQLVAQAEEIQKVKGGNKRIAAQVAEVQASNRELRAQAKEMQAANQALADYLGSISVNIAVAKQLADGAPGSSEQRPSQTDEPELRVLAELGSPEAADAEAVYEHQSPKLLLLQLQSGSPSREEAMQSARELVQSLVGSLGDLAQDQNLNESIVKRRFEEKSQTLSKEKTVQLATEARLNSMLADAKELNEKLQQAVAHLQKIHHQLEGRNAALRQLAQEVGAEPMPVDETVDASLLSFRAKDTRQKEENGKTESTAANDAADATSVEARRQRRRERMRRRRERRAAQKGENSNYQ